MQPLHISTSDEEAEPAEWITVAEASYRLGMSERQARRVAGSLPQSDRTADDVRPARVRWGALRPGDVRQDVRQTSDMSGDLRNSPDTMSETPPISPQICADQPPLVPDPVSELSGKCPAGMSECPDNVRHDVRSGPGHVADLRAEITYLRAELTATREGRDVAEAELRRLLAIAIPASGAAAPLFLEARQPPESESDTADASDVTDLSDQPGQSGPHPADEGEEARTEHPAEEQRGLWHRVRARLQRWGEK